MRNEAEVRDAIMNLAGDIASVLEGGRVAHVRFTPGNGTAYEMLLAPGPGIETIEEGGASDRPMFNAEGDTVFVTMLTVGEKSYPLHLAYRDAPMATYVADKLGLRDTDGTAVWLLLAAICETGESLTSDAMRQAGINVS